MFSKKLIITGVATLTAIIIIVLLVIAFVNYNPDGPLEQELPVAPPDLQGGLPISNSRTPISDTSSNQTPSSNQPTPEIFSVSDPLDEVASNRQEVINIASSFAARFGTYSNQSNYDNIRDLKFQMTRGMQEWSVRYIANLERANPRATVFFSVATRSLTTTIENFSLASGVAVVTVGTRREVNESGLEPNIFNQDIQLDMVKIGGDWLTKGAFWQLPELGAAQTFEPIEVLR